MTVSGDIEMDASIMDGSTLNAGGVACIRNVANPVKVARLVMEKVLYCFYCNKLLFLKPVAQLK